MSNQKLYRTRGMLLINTGRLGTPRSKPQIAPNNEPHADECGCVSCRLTAMADEAIDRHLGSESDLVGNAFTREALAPPGGVLADKPQTHGEHKRVATNTRGPLLLPRGVLAGGAR